MLSGGCTVIGAGVGVGIGVGCRMGRGAISTPAASFAGPSASGVGVGVPPGGRVKSCGRCCAAKGADREAAKVAIAAAEVVRARIGFISAKVGQAGAALNSE